MLTFSFNCCHIKEMVRINKLDSIVKIDFSNKILEACLNVKTIIRSTILASSWSEWLNFLLFLIVYLELHEKNSIYSLCQNSTPIVCHLNVQGILWSNIWMYVIVCLIFFLLKNNLDHWTFLHVPYHLIWVNFSTV